MAKKGQWDERDLVTVDSEAIEQKLKDLNMTQPEIKKSLKSAIRQSLTVVRSGVRKGAANVTSNREKRQKGVGLVVYKNGSGGQVNIYKGDYMKSVKGRGFFTLRWHGATPAKPFFENSVSAVIGQAETKLSDNILQTIEKVASKRK